MSRDLYKYHSTLVAPFLTSDAASQYASAKLSAEEIQQLLTYQEEVGGQVCMHTSERNRGLTQNFIFVDNAVLGEGVKELLQAAHQDLAGSGDIPL